jgi:hypothetical protein
MRTIILVIGLTLCQYGRTQTIKNIFYDLPYNSSTKEILAASKSNSNLTTGSSLKQNSVYFATAKHTPIFLPTTNENRPSIQIDSDKFHRDSSSLPTKYRLSLNLTYSGHDNARAAFEIIDKIVAKEYSKFIDTEVKSPYDTSNNGIRRLYYKKTKSDSAFELMLFNVFDKKTWTIIVSNGLGK